MNSHSARVVLASLSFRKLYLLFLDSKIEVLISRSYTTAQPWKSA
jgi:hypothetical protein